MLSTSTCALSMTCTASCACALYYVMTAPVFPINISLSILSLSSSMTNERSSQPVLSPLCQCFSVSLSISLSLLSNYCPEHTSYNSLQPYHTRTPLPLYHPWCTS